jgi:NitT/TauT family transport system substrate-binding protein
MHSNVTSAVARSLLGLFLALTVSLGCRSKTRDGGALRMGCFANVTHAQGLLGRGRGDFAAAVGRPVTWRIFNAGPSEMEALLAGELDVAYVGPSPAVNAWLRSGKKGLRVIAGAVSGGASLVVHPRAGIQKPADFRGKKIASPELGNTQDVALRAWLRGQGLAEGREVKVLPLKNPDILMLFARGELDAAWVPEPWATRLVLDAGGQRYLNEAELWPQGRFITTVLVAREDWLRRHPEEVRAVLRTHLALTEWISANRSEAVERVRKELEGIHKTALNPTLFTEAFRFLEFTDDPLLNTIQLSAERAWQLGFLPEAPGGLDGLLDLRMLEMVKAERSLVAPGSGAR